MNELKVELIGQDRKWSFPKTEIKVGRDVKCDLILAADEYPMVSRNHLLLRREGDRFWVEDLNTPGGTYLNGKRIGRALLSPGDRLRLAADGPELQVIFGDPSSLPRTQVDSQPVRPEDGPTKMPASINALKGIIRKALSQIEKNLSLAASQPS